MEVFVKAHATIKELISDFPDKGALIVHLPEQATLLDLLKVLGLSAEKVTLVVINGTCVYTAPALNQGDLVEFFPYMAGG
ncbi:MAG: MoaD/ThiS family protein [Desulfotomaculaceae bacterium]|nr:MoaD/ThiS family protein [Desulfotomaculaceae bacterium]